ncbi:type II toxin-antitoxin system HicB family antitoxin [Streptomyces sp. NPDC005576]|uniref:type II toxin-antitoxin system HicB family antitoxin n=1 Tax=Streptomyces sp. NPDC005576 TaxID=3364726 RepID=UPI0036B1A964
MSNPPEQQGIRIVPNHPDDDEGVTVHFPEVDYVDTQVWSVDLGLSTEALRELRDAIDRHLGQPAA